MRVLVKNFVIKSGCVKIGSYDKSNEKSQVLTLRLNPEYKQAFRVSCNKMTMYQVLYWKNAQEW